ncbi:3-methyl-2-oxobutanoate hydroxymethyltransferase [Shimazuella sp. AN120528]|uniref:3-methyl-2-oxobutanoate hydroxymethyltransferase n=1 Tax=Shimazuella soli TaxID=1892854 RepID=UPI001F116748|nr:3-methyl-2-oxobutanoate hydroxymethyltransferase [Shimazuella soli]MCH5585474.1 3-methyl-2-oxobutanoate hydroxymethyltransferase [Shimazuella soli]
MGVTRRTLDKKKLQGEKIAMVTAYDFPTARIAEEAGAEILLVGDSLGMVVLGYDSTIPVTLEDMLHHTKAVTRATKQSMVITDLPFLIAHLSTDEVLKSAGKLMQEGFAYGVKLEGGEPVLEKIKVLTEAGVPVMGHLGLTPQSVNQLGGYVIQGREEPAIKQLRFDAKAVEAAGAFALVLECVPEEIAEEISNMLSIPVIGIGAGRYTDGQVLVIHDLLGIGGDWSPSFVKQFAAVGKSMQMGLNQYVKEVKSQTFPSEEHVIHLKEEVKLALYGGRVDGTS